MGRFTAVLLAAFGFATQPVIAAHGRERLPSDYAQWSRVAVCESGGWRVLGSSYPDSLGIDRANYMAFGGTPLPSGVVSLAGRIAQIRVADRFIRRYHATIPDQVGCGPW